MNSRLGQPFPGKENIDEYEDCRDNTGRHGPEATGDRADDRTDDNTSARRGRQPSQRLCPLMGFHGVRDIRLRHSGRATPQALHGSRSEQHPQRIGVSKDEIGERGRAKADEHGGTPTITVRDLAPDWRRDELRHGERRDEGTDQPVGRVHAFGVERHQWGHEHEPQHVDEADRHQHRQPLHRRAPTPSTIALTSINTTPNAAATPVSASRRLDRISIDTGRVSYVYRTIDATISPSAATNARLAPAARPGLS